MVRGAQSDFDGAIADYTEVIRLGQQGPHAYSNRGNAWLIKKEFDKAIEDFDSALQIDPSPAPGGPRRHKMPDGNPGGRIPGGGTIHRDWLFRSSTSTGRERDERNRPECPQGGRGDGQPNRLGDAPARLEGPGSAGDRPRSA